MCHEYIVNGTKFLARISKQTNTMAVTSCHPYDEQEYHWARRSERTGNWIVFRNGKTVSCHSKALSEEDISKVLDDLDRPLRPIMCHN